MIGGGGGAGWWGWCGGGGIRGALGLSIVHIVAACCAARLPLCLGRVRGNFDGARVRVAAVVVLVDMSDVVQDHDVRAACVCGGASVARERVRVLSALIRACVACVRARGRWAVGCEWWMGRMDGCGVAVGCWRMWLRWRWAGAWVCVRGVGLARCGGGDVVRRCGAWRGVARVATTVSVVMDVRAGRAGVAL